MSTIAVIADVHLLPETEKQLNKIMESEVTFPAEDSQPNTDELIKRSKNADIVLVSPGTKITNKYLEACPSVRYIGICGTSKENVDLDAVEKRSITVTNVVDYGDEPTAEFIFMQLAHLARGMGEYQWRKHPTELMGKTIGIIGLGSLGKAIASLALAYKMKVIYYSKTRKPEYEQKGLVYAEKNELLKTCDIIVISTPTNFVAIDNKDFVIMRNGAVLVQASSGKCVDTEGFLSWIEQEENFAIFDYSAGNDSYQAYKDLPRVIFPKVTAGHTYETKQRLGVKVIKNLESYLSTRNLAE